MPRKQKWGHVVTYFTVNAYKLYLNVEQDAELKMGWGIPIGGCVTLRNRMSPIGWVPRNFTNISL